MSRREDEDEENGSRLRLLEESVDANPDDPSLHLDLGVYLWEKGGETKEIKEKAAEHLVISAKLNPQNAAAFKYLGHYYSRLSHDSQRAIKCYQRAITLNPDDSDSGEAFCDLLDREGKESLELAACRDASNKSPRAFWAFRRLGYLQLHHKKWSQAVQSLQHAIRGYPTSADLWEALGLAYQRLGMLTAAIKAYGRAIELDDARIFALVESGNIFLMLGSYRKGLELFQQAVKITPQNVSAHYGLASGLLGLSKECINLGAFRWGASLLEDACTVARTSADLDGNISCIWKLHGDIQLMYARCLPWTEKSQGVELEAETFSNSILTWKRTCYSAAISARKSYQRALHLAPWQANIYTDIAITSDLISVLDENCKNDPNSWQLAEKMALGALLLEGDNYEFWVALGCLSHHSALKQHALIRGLQLDVSLAIAWAYLGKVHREENEYKLAKQAFDCARSIDPSLALPWAGSADSYDREPTPDEAFESCLRAVQILPLAEFEIGLGRLALLSGNLSSPQVFGAIEHAVQRAPHYPEAHNLHGLVFEARLNYHAAITSYRLARCVLSFSFSNVPAANFQDISINLARTLCKVGNAADAVRECEDLKNKGMLGPEGLQIYALSLWQLGKHDQALSATRNLAASVSTLKGTSADASVSLICRLLYYIAGMNSAITSIQKMPKEFFQSSKISFIVLAIHALDQNDQLHSLVCSNCYIDASHEESIGMHYLIALGELVKRGSGHCLGYHSGVAHLRKALHIYPNSNLIRNLLAYLLLSSEELKDNHTSSRCYTIDASYYPCKEGPKSAWEVLGTGTVACNVSGNGDPKFSFPTCSCQGLNGPVAVQELQKCLRREPWNNNARFLLILGLFQKAREQRFPQHLCRMLDRLISVALSDEIYSKKDTSYQYRSFQLLLCASEMSLQCRNVLDCINHAKTASTFSLPDSYLFFAHLQLCRAYAIEGDFRNLQEEYEKCLHLKTSYHIGWISLKLVGSQYGVQADRSILELYFQECSTEGKSSPSMWMAVFNLVLGLVSIWNQDFLSAEELLAQACLMAGSESCLLLCHGAICMELARQYCDSQFLSRAIRSLNKAQVHSTVPLPIASALLAQAEGSLKSREKWGKNLRLEWFSWPPEMRPAELFFQMHLLARQLKDEAKCTSTVESWQSPEKWVIRAIHTNPSCSRYWKILQKLVQ